MKKNISVKGMSCQGCALRVKKALEQLPHVEGVEVNLEEEQVTVQYTGEVPDQLLKETVEKLGYTAGEVN